VAGGEVGRCLASLRTTVSDLPCPDLAPYSAAQVAFAAAAWPMRAAEELRSALIYRALARAMRAAGAASSSIEDIERVVREEVGHARIAAFVGAALGADAPRYESDPVRRRLAQYPEPRRRASALLLVEVAMGETVSMALFRAGRGATAEPLSRAALQAMLADEVRHQRLGWTLLTSLWPSYSEHLRSSLQEDARRGLAAMEQQVAVPALQRLERGEPFDPAYSALGVLEPSQRVEAFYASVERMILPRLTRLGLDGELAWQGRYRSPRRPDAFGRKG
jgi:hypothetical protein